MYKTNANISQNDTFYKNQNSKKPHYLNQSYFILLILGTFLSSCKQTPPTMPAYKNPNLPIEKRVDDLLAKMTLEEKFWQLYMIPGDLTTDKEQYKHGIFGFQIATTGNSQNQAEQLLNYSKNTNALQTAKLINQTQKYFIEETRLGIPIIPFDEALHGLMRQGATTFPQAIALAATWDTPLMQNIAHAIAIETKSRGIRQILSPVINIARDVRWGRTEETYGEDPFLTTQMAVAYISQFEKLGIITTPKHFLANVGAGGRDSYPIHYNKRLLQEIYLPAFKAAIKTAHAQSIMTAYNSLDGRQCTANHWLLQQKLKKEWNFQGFVISDAGSTGGANVLHFTSHNYQQSTVQALENGLDVIFQTSYNHYPLFYKAFQKGLIKQTTIDNAVQRVLRAKFKLGLFEHPYINPQQAQKQNGTPKHRQLAKKAAQESLVLLQNNNQTLPLNKQLKSLAIIGVDAKTVRLGGYSGPGNHPVSILQGITNKLNKTCKITYTPGCGRNNPQYTTIPKKYLSHYNKQLQKQPGLKAQYYNNHTLTEPATLSRIDPNIEFSWTLFSPAPKKINYDNFSVRWTGQLTSPNSGTYQIGIQGDDGYRLYINNKLIINNWHKQTNQTITKNYHFKKNKTYNIKVEFYETVGNVRIKLIWNQNTPNNWKTQIAKASQIAKQSDAAIVVVGIDEGEFQDRAILSLPGHQEELINQIATNNKQTIVILIGGSAITMQKWRRNVPAIIYAWYSGDEGGNAIADTIFGDYTPAGRLPITFPQHEAQLPLYYNHKPTGRGDDYLNLTGKPLFPFGYGLSYTNFKYHNLTINQPTISKTQSTTATIQITNTGNYDGDEVVQLYIKDLFASVARPIIQLKGFQRIHLKKGETKTITFQITPKLLTMLNEKMETVIEPGKFKIMIGASSNDIRQQKILTVK